VKNAFFSHFLGLSIKPNFASKTTQIHSRNSSEPGLVLNIFSLRSVMDNSRALGDNSLIG
jgi:hypothetical protein